MPSFVHCALFHLLFLGAILGDDCSPSVLTNGVWEGAPFNCREWSNGQQLTCSKSFSFSSNPGFYKSSSVSGSCSGSRRCLLGCGSEKYSWNSGGASCLKCSPGYFCSGGSAAPTTCPAGKYLPITGATSLSDCLACAVSKFSGPGAAVCCETGSYATAGTSRCTFCPRNSFCAPQAQVATPCPSSFFAGVGFGVCCPLGYISTPGTVTCQPCPPGTFTNVQGANSSTFCLPCPLGNFCPGAGNVTTTALIPKPCPLGTYSDTLGNFECTPCPSGRFGGSHGLTSSNCTGLCAQGRYGDRASGDTSGPCSGACSAGRYGIATTLRTSPLCDDICSPGYYGATSGLYTSTCTGICPRGSYCIPGSPNPTPCPAGSYGATTGLYASQQCTPCPSMTYSTSTGATAVTACLACEPGLLSNPGSTECSTCPLGSYCLLTSNTTLAIPCPAGRYSTTSGATSPDVCLSCGIGTFSSNVGVSTATGCSNCVAGSYSDKPGNANCTSCPSGSFMSSTITGSSDPTDCQSCPQGLYNPNPKQTACTYTCPAGYATNIGQGFASISQACTECQPGYLLAKSGDTSCTICPQGQYCSITLLTAGSLCPEGTFSPMFGATDIANCECVCIFFLIHVLPTPFKPPTPFLLTPLTPRSLARTQIHPYRLHLPLW